MAVSSSMLWFFILQLHFKPCNSHSASVVSPVYDGIGMPPLDLLWYSKDLEVFMINKSLSLMPLFLHSPFVKFPNSSKSIQKKCNNTSFLGEDRESMISRLRLPP